MSDINGCPITCNWWTQGHPQHWGKRPDCGRCGGSAGSHSGNHPHHIGVNGERCAGYTAVKMTSGQQGRIDTYRPGKGVSLPPRDVRMDEGFWSAVGDHMAVLNNHGLHQSAAMLTLYEAERKRQLVAIKNLEDQIQMLITDNIEKSEKWAKTKQILERSGMDPDIVLATEELFGEEGE